jgi:hypothetical protein
MRGDSRRGQFAPHAFGLAALRRCPVCQWVIDQDHAEALSIVAKRNPDKPDPPPGLAPESDAQEAAVIAGFSLA